MGSSESFRLAASRSRRTCQISGVIMDLQGTDVLVVSEANLSNREVTRSVKRETFSSSEGEINTCLHGQCSTSSLNWFILIRLSSQVRGRLVCA